MKTDKKKTKGSSALKAASLGRSAVGHVDAHSNSGLANTGTNISYEGATAPGAGGSVGTGYASGQEAAGETIRSVGGQNKATAAGKEDKGKGKAKDKDKKTDEDLQDDDLDEDFELDEDTEELEDHDEEL